MQLEFELTRKDYLDFNMHYAEHNKAFNNSLYLMRFFVPIIFLVFPFAISGTSGLTFPSWFAIYLVLYLIWVSFFPKYYKKILYRRINKMVDCGKIPGVIGWHKLSVIDGVIIDQTSVSETKYATVHKLEQTEKHLFIYVSSIMAYIIPQAAFKSEEEKQDFISLVKLIPRETP
ncbi:MAG: YcxB family protein [Clostridia bacterium]